MKCAFQSQSVKIDLQLWKSNAFGRRPMNTNLHLMLPRMLQILQSIIHIAWSCKMMRSWMMNPLLMILHQIVTQDQKEKMEIIFAIWITHLLRTSLPRLHQLKMYPLLNLILLLSLKPLTLLQREQLLQRK